VGVVALLSLGIGLMLFGVAARPSQLPAAIYAPLIGVLVVPIFVLATVLQDELSTGGPMWDLALTAVHVPLTLARIRIGWAVWSPPGATTEMA
jgi:hypothetical protein